MLSPSKKKRSFQSDQQSVVDEYSRTGDVNTPEDRKNGRLPMRMNVLQSPPIDADDDAKESSPGVFARRRRSITGDEQQIVASPSYEDAEKKAGLKGNIRGFFTRRISMSKKESEEIMVNSPSNDVEEEEDSENDIEQSYLEEIFKRKKAATQGYDPEELSESQFSAAESNIAGDNKSRRGRRRSVTKLMTESRRRDEEKIALDGISPGGGTSVALDNISRRRRRSMNIRPLDAPYGGEDADASTVKKEPNLVRPRRASVSSVDNVTVEATEKRTLNERGSADVQASPNRKSHKKEFADDRRRVRGRESQIGRNDDENERMKSRTQQVIRDPVDHYSYSESEADRKSNLPRNPITERKKMSHGDKRVRNSNDNVLNSRGDGHDQRRNSVVSDKEIRRDRHARDRSRSPPSGPKGRSRSKSRNHARSPTRQRSKSRRRRSEFEESRERRRSKSRHRSSLIYAKSNDDRHGGHGSSSNMNREPRPTRERDVADKEKKQERDIHKVRDGARGKDHDRHCERDREENRGRRLKDGHIPRDPHARESGKGARRSRRAHDDHSSARSFLSDSASSFDSFSQQSRTGSTSSNREETIRGGHASPRGKVSKSKDKLKSYLPSDDKTRSKKSVEMRSPSTISSKQKIDLRIEGSGKHTKSRTERDLSEAQSHHSRNSDACHESYSKETGATVAINVVRPEKTHEESKNSASNAKVTATAEPSVETGRSVAQDKNGAIGGVEKVNDEHVVPGPDPSSNGKRSRIRRVALTSILDTDVGGEREADILSLCSSYSKPLVTARTSYHSELLVKVPDDRSCMLSSDRHDLIYSDSGTGFPLMHHTGRHMPESHVDKRQNSRNNVNGSSSSLDHKVDVKKQLNETDFNSEINHYHDDESVTMAEQAVNCESALFDVADDKAKRDLLRDSTLNKSLQSDEFVSQPKQYDHENDKLSVASEAFDATNIVSECPIAATSAHHSLPVGGDEPLRIMKVTEQTEMTAYKNNSFSQDKPENLQSSMGTPPSHLEADEDPGKPCDSIKMHQDIQNFDHSFEGQVKPDKSSNQSYMTNRSVHDDISEKSLELLSETKFQPEEPDDSIHDFASTRDVDTTSSATLPRKQRNDSATAAFDSVNRGPTPKVKLSRDESHGSAGARKNREAISSDPTQKPILSSPVSSRGRERSRKSVKGASKKGDKHGRTNLKNEDNHHNTSDNHTLSPIQRSSGSRVSNDASSPDSKISSWRPPRRNERGTDEIHKTLKMQRRRSSHRIGSHREVNKNDSTAAEYDEEDVFTLYKWSGNRQDESKVRGERLALRNSIRALSFFRAFETVGT